MIWGNVKYIDHYKGISRALDVALDYLAAGDFKELENGKLDLEAGVFVKLLDQGLKNSRDWEAHKKYIDIHFPLEESEQVTVMETALVPGWGEYDEAKERMKAPACEGGSTVTLHPGDFAVTFPEDAHMAGLTIGEEKTIRKVLVKVPV